MAPYPSGKGVVCKTIMHQFDSDRRLVLRDVLCGPILLPGGESMDDDGGSCKEIDDRCSSLRDSKSLIPD